MSELVLVGNAAGGTIAAFRLDGDSLVPEAVSRVGVGCATFAVDAARDLVYCATKEPEPAVITLALDRDSGAVRERSRRLTGDPLAYLALSEDGALLIGASYHGGWATTWPVAAGVLGASGPRIEYRNVHSAILVGRTAYLASLGEDLIAQCGIDDRGLVPLAEPTVAVEPGSGPRHLLASKDGREVYLLTEFTGQVTRFHRDPTSGTLRRGRAVDAYDTTQGLGRSAYGADPRAEHLIWGADLAFAHGGRFLLCTERTGSTVATVPVGADGTLGEAVAIMVTETQPRGLTLTPDGMRAIVVGELSGAASLYQVDNGGVLTHLDRVETGRGPNWVRVV